MNDIITDTIITKSTYLNFLEYIKSNDNKCLKTYYLYILFRTKNSLKIIYNSTLHQIICSTRSVFYSF